MATYITQKEAAASRGVTIAAITDLIKRGRLRHKEEYGRRLVLKSDVDNFIKGQRANGKRTKKR